MVCNAICTLLNDDICMNLCVLALDPCLYYTEVRGQWCYVLHPSLAHPVAKVSMAEQAKIAELNVYIKQFEK
ncbi:hypothetical protein FM037_03075 [Shewanella psychropiezotolerans]|uniref:Orphan protein n=1 Tax=Shewanella psychropiezotolerans TaxID=2593655 RepID=A0ABX5WUD0_9GAMM|nr:hypothetical protein [Shewanella psychropiezotolerans]QDO82411.1 hypothetical protein FM037_03075 [Shewanella psychropiezotolerans]